LNNNIKIIVIDDEPNSTQLLRKVLKKKGYDVYESNDSLKAKEMIESNHYQIIISDLQMPNLSGLDLLKIKPKESIFIMITGYGSVDSAVESMKNGAYDYVNKPFNIEEFLIKVGKAAENIKLKEEIGELKSLIKDKYKFSNMIGKSKKMLMVFEFIRKIAGINVNTLIEGQSGTGKELVAKAIHYNYNSERKDKPFIAINCSAIPENLLESELFGHVRGAFTGATDTQKGVFEQANGGTLFLDEIAEMPYGLQAKLLRVVETWEIKPLGSDKVKKVDVRLISATNQNLKEITKQKKFREDLYYRISTVSITIPTLSERREDIPLLVENYLKILSKKFDKKYKITSRALDILLKNSWKGNVRELENVLEQAVITAPGNTLDADNFNIDKKSHTLENCFENSMPENLQELEKMYIEIILDKTNWNKLKASQILGIDRKTLYKKIRDYNLENISEI
jgi:DNA-binding NtrC family response regulator